jgi:DNA-binding Xre family transcriptional regulator
MLELGLLENLTNNMYTSDKRILRLIDFLEFEKKISSTSDFCLSVNMPKQNISKIKKGTGHFTVKNISSICKEYNVNANWILGFENNVFKTSNSVEIAFL